MNSSSNHVEQAVALILSFAMLSSVSASEDSAQIVVKDTGTTAAHYIHGVWSILERVTSATIDLSEEILGSTGETVQICKSTLTIDIPLSRIRYDSRFPSAFGSGGTVVVLPDEVIESFKGRGVVNRHQKSYQPMVKEYAPPEIFLLPLSTLTEWRYRLDRDNYGDVERGFEIDELKDNEVILKTSSTVFAPGHSDMGITFTRKLTLRSAEEGSDDFVPVLLHVSATQADGGQYRLEATTETQWERVQGFIVPTLCSMAYKDSVGDVTSNEFKSSVKATWKDLNQEIAESVFQPFTVGEIKDVVVNNRFDPPVIEETIGVPDEVRVHAPPLNSWARRVYFLLIGNGIVLTLFIYFFISKWKQKQN